MCLIYRTETTTKKWKNRKSKKQKRICSEVSVNSNRGIRGVSPQEEKEGCSGKDLQKKKVLSRSSMKSFINLVADYQ